MRTLHTRRTATGLCLVAWIVGLSMAAPTMICRAEGPQAAHVDATGDPLPPGAVARLGTLRFRHGSPIAFLASALDDRVLVSAGRDHIVRFWEAKTGKMIREFHSEWKTPWNPWRVCGEPVAVSPDRRQFLASYDGRPTLFDIATGKRLRAFDEAVISPHLLVFSPDGKLVAAAAVATQDQENVEPADSAESRGTDKSAKQPALRGRVQIWDAASGKSLRVIDAVEHDANSLAFSPDGRSLAVGGQGYHMRLWDALNGQEIQKPELAIETNRSRFRLNTTVLHMDSVAFSANGKKLLGAGSAIFPGLYQTLQTAEEQEPAIEEWDVATGKRLRAFIHDYWGFAAMALSPDGKTLAAGGRNGLKLWDVPSGKSLPAPPREFDELAGELTALCFTADGKNVCFGTEAGTIHTWNIATSKENTPLIGHRAPVTKIAFSPDGRRVATGAEDSTTRVWNLPDCAEQCHIWGSLFGPSALSFSKDGKNVLIVDRRSRWLGAAGGGGLWSFEADGCYIGHVAAASADGKIMIEGSNSTPMKVRDTISGASRTLSNGTSNILAVSPDGKLGGDAGGRVIDLWDLAGGGKDLRRWSANGRLLAMAFSHDNKLLATIGGGTIQLWDVESGKEIKRASQHVSDREEMPLTFSPDGKLLVSARDEIHGWDVPNLSRRFQLPGHRGRINCVGFDGTGRYLASGGDDTTAIVWDLAAIGRKERKD